MPLYERSLIITENILGKKHPNYATTLYNMAEIYYTWGNYDQSLLLYQRVLQLREEILGNKHPDYAACLNKLAQLYSKLGYLDEAFT